MKKEPRNIRKKKLVLKLETIRLQELEIVGGRIRFTTSYVDPTFCPCCFTQ
jgi:hypothetical protein